MMTLAQLKAQIYTAITTNSTITSIMSTRLYWLGKINSETVFPCMVYQELDEIGGYSFGINHEESNILFQIDIYTGSDEVAQMDALYEGLKTVMHGLNYRLMGTNAEFYDPEIQCNIRVTRWEKYNV